MKMGGRGGCLHALSCSRSSTWPGCCSPSGGSGQRSVAPRSRTFRWSESAGGSKCRRLGHRLSHKAHCSVPRSRAVSRSQYAAMALSGICVHGCRACFVLSHGKNVTEEGGMQATLSLPGLPPRVVVVDVVFLERCRRMEGDE